MLIKNIKIAGRIIRFLLPVMILILACNNLNAQRGRNIRVNPFSGGDGGFMNGVLAFFGIVIALAVAIFFLTMIWGAINWLINCMKKISYPLVLLVMGAGIGAGWVSWDVLQWNSAWCFLAAGVIVLLSTVFITHLPKYRYLRY